MIKAFKVLLLLALGLATCSLTQAQGKVNVAGPWDLAIESPQGVIQTTADIKVDGDKISGTLKSPRGERAFTGTIKGDQITMTYTVKFQDNDLIITLTGTVAGDSIKGMGDAGGLAQIGWSGKRHVGEMASTSAPPVGANVTGTWEFAVETAQGSGSPTFTFSQDGEKLTGQYKGAFGEGPVEGTVKGAAIDFVVKVNAQGQEVIVSYTGTIEKDGMKGTVKLGEFGSGTWTAKRQ
jgi:hypothetical protein